MEKLLRINVPTTSEVSISWEDFALQRPVGRTSHKYTIVRVQKPTPPSIVLTEFFVKVEMIVMIELSGPHQTENVSNNNATLPNTFTNEHQVAY